MKEDDRDNILSTILEVGAFICAYFAMKEASVYYKLTGDFWKFFPGLLMVAACYSFAVRSYTFNKQIKRREKAERRRWEAEMKRIDDED